MKKLKMKKYETIWPGYLFIVDCTSSNPSDLLNYFDFKRNDGVFQEPSQNIVEELNTIQLSAEAACYPVVEKSTGHIGVLLVILDYYLSTNTIAHESAHLTDYFFQLAGANSEEFSDGNEPYAYTVGYIAGSISNFLIDVVKNGRKDYDKKTS